MSCNQELITNGVKKGAYKCERPKEHTHSHRASIIHVGPKRLGIGVITWVD